MCVTKNFFISIVRDELLKMNNFRKKKKWRKKDRLSTEFFSHHYYYYSNRITNLNIRIIGNYSNEILARYNSATTFLIILYKLFLFLRIELFNLIRKYFLIGNIIHSLIGNKYDIIIIDIILYDFFFKLITRCTTTRRGIKRECGIIINHEVIYCFEMRLIE